MLKMTLKKVHKLHANSMNSNFKDISPSEDNGVHVILSLKSNNVCSHFLCPVQNNLILFIKVLIWYCKIKITGIHYIPFKIIEGSEQNIFIKLMDCSGNNIFYMWSVFCM